MERKANSPHDTFFVTVLFTGRCCFLRREIDTRVATTADRDDSRHCALEGLELNVRIWGIDAVERGQDGFMGAKVALGDQLPVGAEV